jgi:aspartate racemase
MGPMAGADLFTKLIQQTPATIDQDHIPVFVYSVPQSPDRNLALYSGGPDPFSGLLEGARKLVSVGARCIAIPCNSAHHWHARLTELIEVPILHIADAAIGGLQARGLTSGKIGVLAAEVTLRTRIYTDRLAKSGYVPVIPSETADIMRAIRLIKAGDRARARRLLKQQERLLLDEGCQSVILGCTEIPLALCEVHAAPQSLDANLELARACIAWYRSHVATC